MQWWAESDIFLSSCGLSSRAGVVDHIEMHHPDSSKEGQECGQQRTTSAFGSTAEGCFLKVMPSQVQPLASGCQ